MEMQKSVIFFLKKIENRYVKNKKYHKVGDNCHYRGEYRGAVHSKCNLKYSVLKKIQIHVYVAAKIISKSLTKS